MRNLSIKQFFFFFQIGAAIAIYIYKGRVSEEVSNKMIEGM